MPLPFSPSSLSRNEAQALTALAQRARELPLHCAGAGWRARLQPLIAPAWPAESLHSDTFASIEWAGALLQLQLPAEAAQLLLSALLDGAALPPVPEEMQAATLEAALQALLAGLEGLGRGAARIVATSVGAPPAALAHAVAWQLRSEPASSMPATTLAGMLRADGLGLLLMAGLVAGLPQHAGPLASEDMRVALHLDIGYATLEAAELEHLFPGDVLLMEQSFVSAGRMLWLQAPGAGGLHVYLPDPAEDAAGDQAPFLTVVQSWTHAMPALDPAPNEAADLLAIPVRLTFDLGEIALTLAELRALQPGQTIQLGQPIAEAVRVRANGALVGEGELVEIDGQLGVLLRRLFAPRSQDAT